MSLTPAANYELLYSRADIQRRVESLGDEITPWAENILQSSGQAVLAVCVLRGAVFFYADILRAVGSSIEPAFCRTSGYAVSSNQLASGMRIAVEDVAADGRHILLIDDICDSGRTLEKLEKVFLDLGAKEVRSAVLVHRQLSSATFTPAWAGFVYKGPEWLVGYGMDDRNLYRNLAEVYRIPGTGN